MVNKTGAYLGNVNLKKTNIVEEYNEDKIKEYIKCSQDIEYFLTKYIRIVNVDKGLIDFEPYDYQLKIARTVEQNRFTICKLPRQSGKTTIVAGILLWYILFNKEYNIGILAHKHSQSREILARLQLAYEWIPSWMQQGIAEWNKGSIKLENGSGVVTAATTGSALRGGSYNLIYLDEFAFIPSNMQEEFFRSVYPVITSGKTTKIVITSTPNGMNYFYKLWTDAEEGRNEYQRVAINWWDTPGRDEKWKEQTIRNTSELQFQQEFECEFLGSSNTLIRASKLRQLTFRTALEENEHLKVYAQPDKTRQYAMVVDTARGLGGDYSAYIIFDITNAPYTMAAVYRNNDISPLLFPDILYNMGKHYNYCPILVETNDIGQQVADILYHDLEYENLIFGTQNERDGQIISGGFAGRRMHYGVRTTKQVKRIGCSNLKNIIESDKLIVEDYNIIYELSRFIAVRQSYEADEGATDDLVMCCVLFAWMINQNIFKDANNIDIRQEILKHNLEMIEEQLLSFGYSDGEEDVMVSDKPDPNRIDYGF
jgi:hypothetical protein